MKILNSADWHIILNKKKVPYKWQEERFIMLFEKLRTLEKEVDVHVISGDVFDKAPNTDEICLVLSYLNSVTIPTIIIPGNHSSTKKGHSFWEAFERENAITNTNVHLFTKNGRIKILDQWFQCFPYGEMQLGNLPKHIEDDILITHIRGEVPPHITPEFDFEKIRPWKLTLIGDLHFNHQYKDFNVFYPGSPINTTFDRNENREYGVDIFTVNGKVFSKQFVDLKLPKLLRKTVKSTDAMIEDPYNHIIYEITGSLDDLAKIKNSALLDKKLVDKPSSSSKLDLQNKNIYEELSIYLNYKKISNVKAVLEEFTNSYTGEV